MTTPTLGVVLAGRARRRPWRCRKSSTHLRAAAAVDREEEKVARLEVAVDHPDDVRPASAAIAGSSRSTQAVAGAGPRGGDAKGVIP